METTPASKIGTREKCPDCYCNEDGIWRWCISCKVEFFATPTVHYRMAINDHNLHPTSITLEMTDLTTKIGQS